MRVERDESALWANEHREPRPELVISKLGKPVVWPYLAIRRGDDTCPIARLMVDETVFWQELATTLCLTIQFPDGTVYEPPTSSDPLDKIPRVTLEDMIRKQRAALDRKV